MAGGLGPDDLQGPLQPLNILCLIEWMLSAQTQKLKAKTTKPQLLQIYFCHELEPQFLDG